MTPLEAMTQPEQAQTKPLCPVFGECGGCAYQDLSYEDELKLKANNLRELFETAFGPLGDIVKPVVPSPDPYFYRHRLDITARKTREGFLLGFQVEGARKIIEIDSCVISRKEISDFIPELKKQMVERWIEGYKNANLVVKTCDDGRVLWGGMGRRSLSLPEKDYLWTEIHGKRIFYSLDTFFQANLSILPTLMNHISKLAAFDSSVMFLDLYAGVGLFGVYFSDQIGKLVMIEDSASSVLVMKHNQNYHKLEHATLCQGRVEENLGAFLSESEWKRKIAIIDPPRKGLHPGVASHLAQAKQLEKLFYLSCSPETLVRDLKNFTQHGWKIESVLPFDFFPKTRHLETLVLLRPESL